MRKSRYTFACFGREGERLLFNTAFGRFAALDEDAFAAFEACEGPLAQKMLDDLFLTDLTEEEELSAQKSLFEAACADSTELYLVLAPTYACNFRCPYCYEQGHNGIKGKMSGEVIDAICSFAEERHKATGYSSLKVQWYGGDPSLALDIVENLSGRLISWCDEHGVGYDAMMLSNCNNIDESAAKMLSSSGIRLLYMTIDGFEDTHNARRVSAVGTNSFQRNLDAAKYAIQYGISVKATMNVDRVNWGEFNSLREMLRNEIGVELNCARLCDYGHFFGTRDFKRPQFDLFEHDEYARLQHDEFVKGGYSATEIGAMLSPVPRFCNGQRFNYYVIDTIGDVYLCDGYIGERNHVAFSLFDDASTWHLGDLSHNPYESKQCRDCFLLPICQGNCDWERRATGMPCHPLLTTLPDYLRDYRACFGERVGSYHRFV